MELPDLWTCAVCRARHPAPERQCRRCGADLLALAAVQLAAVALTHARQPGASALHRQAD
jgi:ribosomal protein L40E